LRIHKPVDGYSLGILSNECDKLDYIHSEMLLLEYLHKNTEIIIQRPVRNKNSQMVSVLEDFTPVTYEINYKIGKFPVFIKPDAGQGSKGAKVIYSQTELDYELLLNQNMVICEYLPGEEFTIDCFTDRNGELRVCVPRKRNRIRTGISVNSVIVPMNEKIHDIAMTINRSLKFNGSWFFQLKLNGNGEYKLLEIAPRIAGTMGLSRNMGINHVLLTLYNFMKMPVSIIQNDFNIEVDRALISRYRIDIEYDTVYLDLDDTLIISNKVNDFLMMYLYQLINRKIKIILLSK
jgi:predicted ATP-grasp superfamily ATP-dependent carboligase